ncbi:HAD family hydrolase [Thermococcus sp. MV11]|uniref:HAD family hydrolase n=1 Tax=Thermococcus sp. MV11 TaxID=1638267 RepID=UPI001431540E|nr:HAD family hydrolase [Thermococcus sp. MV11]NJE02806.1 hydrolase [Thermococcus sp. MV11]
MWVVFDVDGVLIDVGESYDVATRLTAEYFLRLFGVEREIKLEWVRELRRKGSFGDDFKVSEALILFALSGRAEELIEEFPEGGTIEWVRERFGFQVFGGSIERVFNTFYLGREYPGRLFDFPGLWKRERPIVRRNLLEEASARFKLGVVTGRSALEMKLAERVIGFRFENVVTRESYLKPDPRALWELVKGERGVYVGDTVNDGLFIENYRRRYGREFGFVMVGRDVRDVNEFLEELLEGEQT